MHSWQLFFPQKRFSAKYPKNISGKNKKFIRSLAAIIIHIKKYSIHVFVATFIKIYPLIFAKNKPLVKAAYKYAILMNLKCIKITISI